MDDETLMLLLKGGHLNMPERVARGVWPHAALSFDDLADFLAKILEKEVWFPYQWEPHQAGQAVREGGTIEKQGRHRYVYRNSASVPTAPATVGRSVEKVFRNPRDAAIHYLKWDLHLPGDLDGWKVVK